MEARHELIEVAGESAVAVLDRRSTTAFCARTGCPAYISVFQ